MKDVDITRVSRLACHGVAASVHEVLYYLHITWIPHETVSGGPTRQLAYCLIKDIADHTGWYERVGVAIFYAPKGSPTAATWPKRTVTII